MKTVTAIAPDPTTTASTPRPLGCFGTLTASVSRRRTEGSSSVLPSGPVSTGPLGGGGTVTEVR